VVNYLSLFSGAGGGDLSSQYLLGHRCIGYCEIDDYCQRVICQRIKDGYLHDAPIFTDIKAFVSSGCAELYRGVTDIITAGFPCQIFSVAGKLEGHQDDAEHNPRNLFPATRDVIGVVRPRYIYLENVAGLLASSYIWRILSDIARLGYLFRAQTLSAAEMGAPHKRLRWWLVGEVDNSTGAGCKA